MKQLSLICLAAALFTTAPVGLSLADEPTGEGFAHTCAACHGTNGELVGEAFQPLAGMSKDPFVRAMKDFRDLKRPSSIMSHIADGYNDEEIDRMAEYFSSLPKSPIDTVPYESLGRFQEVR